MPSLSVTIPTAIGNLQIYANQRQLDKADKLIRETPDLLTKAYKSAALIYAERMARIAKTCLLHGMPPRGSGVSWPAHAPSTVRVLGAHSLLYWSSQYYHNIQVIRRGKYIAAGVPSGTLKTRPDGNKPSGLRLSQVAKILEFGTEDGKIPSRPLWQYLWPSVGGKQSYKQELVQQIRKQIRKYM